MPITKREWSIEYYISPSGNLSPIASFIESLPEKAKAKLFNTFELLKGGFYDFKYGDFRRHSGKLND